MYKDVDGRLPKHLPNSNVMFEYGYALSCKGENRMITLAKMGRGEHVEFMPFDINHNTLTSFRSADDLIHLADWIKNIIVDVDKERAAFVPDYACDLVFMGSLFDGKQTAITPTFKKTVYITKEQQAAFSKINQGVETIKSSSGLLAELALGLSKSSRESQFFNVGGQKTNKSYCMISLWFINKGNSALDNCNLTIVSSDKRVRFSKTNVERSLSSALLPSLNTYVYDKYVEFHVNTLNPGEDFMLDSIYVYAPYDVGSFQLAWNMNSRTYKWSGTLEVLVEPEYMVNYVENDDKAGAEVIEDYIVTE